MNVTNANWANIVNTAIQNSTVEGADKLQVSVAQDANGNLSVTFTGADGQVYNFTTTAPELDETTGELTEEGKAALEAKLAAEIEKLKELSEEFKTQIDKMRAGTDVLPHGIRKMMFSIYALMNLMLEISMKQREAARKERKADLDRSVTDIHNQAETQRTAAMLGLWIAIGSTVLNIGAQIGIMWASSKASKAAHEMESNAGATQMSRDLRLLTAEDSKATGKNLDKIEKKMPEGSVDGLKAEGGKFRGTADAAGELDNANATYKKAIEARDGFKNDNKGIEARKDPVTIDGKELNEETSINDIDEAIKSCEQKVKNSTGADKTKAQGELDSLKGLKLHKLEGDVTTARNGLEQKQTKFASAAQADLTMCDGKLADARLKLREMKQTDAPKSEIKNQEKVIKGLEQEREWGRAFITDAKMKAGMKDSIANDIKSCEHVLGQKMEALKLNGEYRKYNSKVDAYAAFGRMADQLGQMLTTMSRQLSEYTGAGASEYQAAAKVHENMQQESEDLAQSAIQLLKAILDLLRQILEAENQSIRQIVA